jgi:hypothetical protein
MERVNHSRAEQKGLDIRVYIHVAVTDVPLCSTDNAESRTYNKRNLGGESYTTKEIHSTKYLCLPSCKMSTCVKYNLLDFIVNIGYRH